MGKPPCRPTYARKRGFTLLEMMVATMVSALMLVVLFAVYRICASAMMKGDAQSTLRQGTMTVADKLTRDLERSVYGSVSISADGRAVSFLSALDANGQFQFNQASQEPVWQNYLIYYYDAPARQFCRREVSVAGSPQQSAPTPIENFGPNQPVDTYTSGGLPVAHEIDFCEFTVANQLLRLKLRADKKRYGSERPETFSLESVTSLRN